MDRRFAREKACIRFDPGQGNAFLFAAEIRGRWFMEPHWPTS